MSEQNKERRGLYLRRFFDFLLWFYSSYSASITLLGHTVLPA